MIRSNNWMKTIFCLGRAKQKRIWTIQSAFWYRIEDSKTYNSVEVEWYAAVSSNGIASIKLQSIQSGRWQESTPSCVDWTGAPRIGAAHGPPTTTNRRPIFWPVRDPVSTPHYSSPVSLCCFCLISALNRRFALHTTPIYLFFCATYTRA